MTDHPTLRPGPHPGLADSPFLRAARGEVGVVIGTRAAAFASWVAVALETNGTVRLARGLASST